MKKAVYIIFLIIILLVAILLAYMLGKSDRSIGNISNRKTVAKEKTKKKEKIKPETKKETKILKVYFAKGQYLEAEEREAKRNPKTALQLILKGPSEEDNVSYIPRTVKLLDLTINKETAIVNFSKEILAPGNVGAKAEELTIYQITNTLTEFSNISEVIIRVEGKSEGEVDGYPVEDFWGHVGLYEQPFKRNESLIKD